MLNCYVAICPNVAPSPFPPAFFPRAKRREACAEWCRRQGRCVVLAGWQRSEIDEVLGIARNRQLLDLKVLPKPQTPAPKP